MSSDELPLEGDAEADRSHAGLPQELAAHPDRPGSAEALLDTSLARSALESACSLMGASASRGAIFWKVASGDLEIVATTLLATGEPVYLRHIAGRAMASGTTTVYRSPRLGRNEGRAGLAVAEPVVIRGECMGSIALIVADVPATETLARRSARVAIGWLHAAHDAKQLNEQRETLERTRAALQALAVIDEHERFEAAAMQCAAHLEGQLGCRRVSLGTADRNGNIEVVAFSHASWFDKASDELRHLRAAMEEAFDQDETVVLPPVGAVARPISLSHRVLAEKGACLSVVLRDRSRRIGVITLERSAEAPFREAEIAACEAIAALVGPVLEIRRERQKWLHGRAFAEARRYCLALIGPRRPGVKLLTTGVLALVTFLSFATGEHRVAARAVIEGEVQRVAAAPFDGFIATEHVRAGQVVRKGDVLATLDDRDLKLDQLRWLGEREQRLKQYEDAYVKHDRARAGVLAAQVDQAESHLALAEENLARARLTAPLDGVVVSGDLSQLVGAPVEKGKVLFEIAPLATYRVVLKVDERDIVHVQLGQAGQLAIRGLSGKRVPFRVRNLTAVTLAEDGHNLFRVEAEILDKGSQLRPGMEGLGKIDAGPHRLIWIWTHSFTDWVRLKTWSLLP